MPAHMIPPVPKDFDPKSNEGIVFKANGHVDMQRFQWEPDVGDEPNLPIKSVQR